MSHPRERLGGKSEGGTNLCLEQKVKNTFLLSFAQVHIGFLGNCCNPVEFKIKEERKRGSLTYCYETPCSGVQILD